MKSLGQASSSPGPREAAAVHVSTAHNSLGLLELRGSSSDPPAASSQPPGKQAVHVVNVRASPFPLENLGKMSWKYGARIEQVPCFTWKIWGCRLLQFPRQGLPDVERGMGSSIPSER